MPNDRRDSAKLASLKAHCGQFPYLTRYNHTSTDRRHRTICAEDAHLRLAFSAGRRLTGHVGRMAAIWPVSFA